jgi:hypothetical protein
MNLHSRYVRNENFVFRTIDHETILVPIKDNVGDMGCIYSLNGVGAFVWEHLDGEKSVGDVKNLLVESFDGTPEWLENDLEEFIEQLGEIDAVREIE